MAETQMENEEFDLVDNDNIELTIGLDILENLRATHIEVLSAVCRLGGKSKYKDVYNILNVANSNMSTRAKHLEELGLVERLSDEGEAGKSLKVPDKFYSIDSD